MERRREKKKNITRDDYREKRKTNKKTLDCSVYKGIAGGMHLYLRITKKKRRERRRKGKTTVVAIYSRGR